VIDLVNSVDFELSNICVFKDKHKRCPLHQLDEPPRILPTPIIVGVMNYLGQAKYSGRIGFNVYNEPLIDPRLTMLLNIAKDTVPKSTRSLWTNGFNLNQDLLDDLRVLHGVSHVRVSAYFGDEYSRLVRLIAPKGLKYEVNRQFLDNRLNVYDRPVIHDVRPCSAPFGKLTIASTAEVILCCLDFERRHVFGKLPNQAFPDILANPAMMKVYKELQAGYRQLEICQRCGWVR